MAWKPTYAVPFRRRLKAKTDYSKRLALLKSGKPRLVVRRSNTMLIVQLVQYFKEGDKCLVNVNSGKLAKLGWKTSTKNLPAAYLTGLLCGSLALGQDVKEAVLDIGRLTPVKGSLAFAALKGAVDAGLTVSHDAKAFPSEERIRGKHIAEFAAKLSPEELNKRFSICLKKGFNPKDIEDLFEKVKVETTKEKVKE